MQDVITPFSKILTLVHDEYQLQTALLKVTNNFLGFTTYWLFTVIKLFITPRLKESLLLHKI